MKKQTIFLVGGGSGGHITPLLAIGKEVSQISPDIEIIFVTERGGNFANILDTEAVQSKKIFAGKLRRYHGVSFWRQLLDIKTHFLNIRDVLFLIFGIVESFVLIIRYRPKVIFLKGGFVSLPVGICARLLGASYVTHDSDARASLTNKVVGKKAIYNLVSLSEKSPTYDPKKTMQVGVPISDEFAPVDQNTKSSLRGEFGIDNDMTVILVVGGSIGADRLNKAVAEIAPKLLENSKKLMIIHQTGKNQQNYYKSAHDRIRLVEFIDNMSQYGAVSDVIVSRAGATAISEFATQRKALILVPNPNLTGGHQLENAKLLVDARACLVAEDSSNLADNLSHAVEKVLRDDNLKKELETNIAQFDSSSSAKKIAQILVDIDSV
ncbi:MAG: UDP-N-acetylglucosamine--N-acetylmuramyl-(pentapeptide) pyrophosphoryl-undecaprenol N-acetylglucosamine transferase [Patescibacteria group bacterium]